MSDPTVQKVLAAKSPRQRASELVRGTKVNEVALRKKAYEGGKQVLDASQDPMLALARLVDSQARDVRKIVETQGEAKQQSTRRSPRPALPSKAPATTPTPPSPCAWPLAPSLATRRAGSRFRRTRRSRACTSAPPNRNIVRRLISPRSGWIASPASTSRRP